MIFDHLWSRKPQRPPEIPVIAPGIPTAGTSGKLSVTCRGWGQREPQEFGHVQTLLSINQESMILMENSWKISGTYMENTWKLCKINEHNIATECHRQTGCQPSVCGMLDSDMKAVTDSNDGPYSQHLPASLTSLTWIGNPSSSGDSRTCFNDVSVLPLRHGPFVEALDVKSKKQYIIHHGTDG